MRKVILLGSLIFIDQALKAIFSQYFSIFYNQGIALGVMSGISILFLTIILGILIINFFRHKIGFAELLILSGGISNLLDRFTKGAVVDWISVLGIWFNLADIYITIGALILINKCIINRPMANDK